MIRLLFLSLTSTIFFACSQQHAIEDIEFSTTPYQIKTGYDGTNFYFHYTLQNTDTGEYVYYYDHLMKRISIVDFDDREIIEHVSLNNDKYKIKGVSEILLTDSLMILKNLNWFYWFDRDGKVQKYEDAETFRGMRFNNEFDYSFRYKKSYQNYINTSNQIIQFSAFPSNYDKAFFDTPILTQVFLNEDSVHYSDELNPTGEYKNTNETFGYRSNPLIVEDENKVYVTFPFTPDIFIYDRGNLSFIRKVKISHFNQLANNRPIAISKFKEITQENFQNETSLDDQAYYHNLYYDPFRELFYRPVARELKEHEDEIDYKMWLLVFNDDLELLGKLDLKDKFSPFLYISKKGLFIRKKKQQENRIDLHRLDFELP